MPLFKHKEKNRPDLTNQQTVNPASGQPQHQHNNSYHDSTYYSNSNSSTMDSRVQQPSPQPNQNQNQNQNREGQRPGTTVTTTTTTTTTTTVAPDGTTQTYSHPYNPSTDPPPQASEIVVDQRLPSNTSVVPGTNPNPNPNQNIQETSQPTSPPQGQTRPTPTITQQAPTPSHSYREAPPRKPTPQQLQQFTPPPGPPPAQEQNTGIIPPPRTEAELPAIPPSSPSTTGGRPIPPRTALTPSAARGTSPNPALHPTNTDTEAIPQPPARSPKRNSMDGAVRPLNTNKSTAAPEAADPVSPSSPARSHTPNFSHPSVGVPTSPSRANDLGTTTTISAAPPHPQGKRESLFGAIKGLHGAGEALRGTVNGTIARASHDTAEVERMRIVKEKGLGEFRGSGLKERAGGLREGFREKAGERQRSRRLSAGTGVHGSEGPGGLGVVEERDR